MDIKIDKEKAVFSKGEIIAGIYRLDDPFKPYIHPLKTPKGNIVTAASPADHRHHKGLMYSLRCADINFWEENPERQDCGIQKIKSTAVLKDKNGIVQEILWCAIDANPQLDTYLETREIFLKYEKNEFVWNWKSHRVALRDHELIKSEWSAKRKDGFKINYHGLGIRLPWSFIYPNLNTNGFKIEGEDISFEDALGSIPESATYWGKLDGKWEPDVASVTIEQKQEYSLYVMHQEFPFMALGPSNASNVTVQKGDVFDEEYNIVVSDQ